MTNLDDLNQIKKLDPINVLGSIEQLGLQCQQAWTESLNIKFPSNYKQIKNVVVCSMGGSRFTPLIIKELYKKEIQIPYIINDDYDLPGFVNNTTLVILSSYSGNTEEVISCGQQALKKQAKITGICSGGELAQLLRSNSLPVYIFNPIHNPCAQPRIGVGYMTLGHLGLLYNTGLINITPSKIQGILSNFIKIIHSFDAKISTTNNLAKQFAIKLFNRYPYYIVSEHLVGSGNAIANQTNENSKAISSFRIIPELNHHLMEGLSSPKIHQKLALFIFFQSRLYHKRIQQRYVVTKDVVKKIGVETLDYNFKSQTKLGQVLEMITFGSFTTMYLSFLYGEDPSLIPWVDYFKKKLKEMS